MAVTVYKRTIRVGGTSECVDNIGVDNLITGDLVFVVDSSNVFDVYECDTDSDATHNGTSVIQPETNPGRVRWIQKRQATSGAVPDGTIVAWLPGFFGNTANGSYSAVDPLGNDPLEPITTIDLANAYLNSDGWYVCDGESLEVSESTFFNTSGRFLPNLADARFIYGGCEESYHTVGAIGGNNSMMHDHSMPHYHVGGSHRLDITEMPQHTHEAFFYTDGTGTDPAAFAQAGGSNHAHTTQGVAGGTAYHDHGNTGTAISESTAYSVVTENKPQFLSCFYIIKVI